MLSIKTEDIRLQMLNEIKELNPSKLYILGNGLYYRIIKSYLRSEGGYEGDIIPMVDDEYFQANNDGVIPVSYFLATDARTSPVVFGLNKYDILQEKKEKLHSKVANLFDFQFSIVNGKRIQWDPTLAKKHEKQYQKTFDLLSDDRSKKVMQLYLNAAVAGEFDELFKECYEEPSYFNRITKHLKVDTLVDVGAYDGDSIHDFVKVFPDYKKIIAFEPDPVNFEKLSNRKQNENIRNLLLERKGIGSANGYVSFQVNGKSDSFQSNEGDFKIQIVKLDDISHSTVGKIMLKMDIEGAELDALHGAVNMIREYKPILAICVYHKENDLIDIPQFIHETAGAGVYDYYLGFHGMVLGELVFYAIPKYA